MFSINSSAVSSGVDLPESHIHFNALLLKINTKITLTQKDFINNRKKEIIVAYPRGHRESAKCEHNHVQITVTPEIPRNAFVLVRFKTHKFIINKPRNYILVERSPGVIVDDFACYTHLKKTSVTPKIHTPVIETPGVIMIN